MASTISFTQVLTKSTTLAQPSSPPIIRNVTLGLDFSNSVSRKHFKIPTANQKLTTRRRGLRTEALITQTETDTSRPTKVQELVAYEFNELDRWSPSIRRTGFNFFKFSLGDIVVFSNKLYSGDLKIRYGITSGWCIVTQNMPDQNGDRFEACYSFYFGDYGHISVQGPYLSYADSILAVVGGSGIFEGVYGTVKLSNILFPLKLHYVFSLKGIQDLPKELIGGTPVEPNTSVEPSADAKAGKPGATVPNFTV